MCSKAIHSRWNEFINDNYLQSHLLASVGAVKTRKCLFIARSVVFTATDQNKTHKGMKEEKTCVWFPPVSIISLHFSSFALALHTCAVHFICKWNIMRFDDVEPTTVNRLATMHSLCLLTVVFSFSYFRGKSMWFTLRPPHAIIYLNIKMHVTTSLNFRFITTFSFFTQFKSNVYSSFFEHCCCCCRIRFFYSFLLCSVNIL